jgi:uncharacterized protein (TIGR02246 family)
MRTGLLLGFLLLAAAPAYAQSAANEIEQANARFESAFNGCDATAVAALYRADATLLPPDGDIVEGRDAIQAYWRDVIESGAQNLSLRSVRLDTFDNGAVAREIGRFSLEAPGPQNEASRIEGKYVVLWRKNGSDWQLDTDIWNTIEPPEPAVGSSAPGAVGVGSGAAAPAR